MQLSKHLHLLKIPFQIKLSPAVKLDRFVNVLLVYGEKEVGLIDSGVAGAEAAIFAYLHQTGRRSNSLKKLFLSHSHPDHLGAARAIQAETGCQIYAHPAERAWIEDTERQGRERPVPGFDDLVGGPVQVDHLLEDGDLIEIGAGIPINIRHTPGHSPGSISLHFPGESAIFTGDALPLPGALPIFSDWQASVASLTGLKPLLRDNELLLSSWAEAVRGRRQEESLAAALAWLARIKGAVTTAAREKMGADDPLALCRATCASLGLPPLAVNPLVARSFAACLS